MHFFMHGGKKSPSEWERGICVVEDNPNTPELPLIMAGIVLYPKPTIWDGSK